MSFLERLLEKIHTFFFSEDSTKDPFSEEEKTYLSLFLKFGEDFVFITENCNVNNPKSFKPFLVPLTELGRIEDKIFKINNFMFEEFDVSPDRIRIAKDYFSLAPIKNHKYYFAIVDISYEDMKEIKKRDPHGNFLNLPTSYIALKSNENLFFNILVKLIRN